MAIHAPMEFVRTAALVSAVASAVAALLSLGGAVSERLDVLTHFTPFIFAGGVLAFALAMIMGAGAGPTLLAAAVAIVVSGSIMAPEILAAARRPSATAPSGEPLKLIQFNLWARNVDPRRTARWIEGEDADVVVVEEAVGAGARVVQAIARQRRSLGR